jgi:hypothetical protein
MVQVDIPFAFGIGSLMAVAAEDGLRSEKRTDVYIRGLTANLLLQTLFVLWLPLYLLVSNFGFQTSHMWWHGDAITDHPLLLPIFVVVYFVAALSGYATGVALVVRGNSRAAFGIFLASCAFFAGWMGFQPHRTLMLGTYREWVEGRGIWIWHDKGFMTMLGLSFLQFAVAARYIYKYLQRDARGVASHLLQQP